MNLCKYSIIQIVVHMLEKFLKGEFFIKHLLFSLYDKTYQPN